MKKLQKMMKTRSRAVVAGLVTVVVLLTLCSGLLGWEIRAIWKNVGELERVEQRQRTYENAVRLLSLGSVKLTDAVRRFVATGNEGAIYDYFHEAKVARRREKCFETLAGLPNRSELEGVLRLAMTNSVLLMQTEYRAMRLAVRLRKLPADTVPEEVHAIPLTPEDEALTGQALQERINDFVCGNAYAAAQTAILGEAASALRQAGESEGLHVSFLQDRMHTSYRIVLALMGGVVVLLLTLSGLIILTARQRSRLQRTVLLQRAERNRLEAADKAKSLFFSSVSHDIRTPLGAIIGFAELLESGSVPPEEVQQDLRIISSSGKGLLQLINDLLDLSKLEAGKMVIVHEPTDVGALVADVLPVFGPQIGERHQQLLSKVPDLPKLMVDPHRIRQILFNLISNAVKYAGSCTIRVLASYQNEVFTLTVVDGGVGLSAEAAEKVMQPYSQAVANDRKYGTGLGLSVCRKLAECMGGEFTLKTAPGQGCAFTLTVPNVREAEVEAGAVCRIVVPEERLPHRVLVVDDSPVNRTMLKSMLTTLGVTDITLAENGRVALAKLASEPTYDCVLTDMWMPEMNGAELVKAIRADAEFASLKVCSITADVEAQKTYREQGFDEILLKPMTRARLREVLERLHAGVCG